MKRVDSMRKLLKGTDGAIAILTAMLLPVLIGFAAWAIDASLLLYRQERLQVAVDIGARAGAEVLRRGGTEVEASAFAKKMTEINAGAAPGTAPNLTVVIPTPDRVEVTATLQVERIFSSIFGRGAFEIAANSVAIYVLGATGETCFYIQDLDAQRAMRLNQNSALSLTGCNVVVASDHVRALVLEKDAKLRASCVDVTGGIAGSAQIILSQCLAPSTGAVVPPSTLVVPAPPRPSGPCTNQNTGQRGTNGAPDSLTPVRNHPSGLKELRLCNGLRIERDTVGSPGIYFISGDDLEIKDDATLTLGPGAVIVLQGDTEIAMERTSRLRITAPEQGTFDGLSLIVGHDRESPKNREHLFGVIEIAGAVVLPNEYVKIDSTSTVANCTRFVVGRLELSRSARFDSTCNGSGGQAPGSVRLLPNP